MDRAELRERVYKIFNPLLMGLLAMAVIPLVLLDFAANLGPTGTLVTIILDWIVVGIFFTEYAAKILVAESKWQHIRSPWNLLDLAIILLPLIGLAITLSLGSQSNVLAASPILRLLRIIRVFAFTGKSIQKLQLHQTLVRNRFYQFAGAALTIFFIISSVFFLIEAQYNPKLTYADALWWGWGALSTIGSEVIPATGVGRVLGAVLMTLGLAFAGFFTANIVSYFQELRRPQAENETNDSSGRSSFDTPTLRDLAERQRLLEGKVDTLLALLRQEEHGKGKV